MISVTEVLDIHLLSRAYFGQLRGKDAVIAYQRLKL